MTEIHEDKDQANGTVIVTNLLAAIYGAAIVIQSGQHDPRRAFQMAIDHLAVASENGVNPIDCLK